MPTFMNKNIFITGASGFIGSHLTEKLLKKGYKVTALVPYDINSSQGWLKKVQNVNLKIIPGDICDENFILKNTNNFYAIIHLAALISIPYSYVSPKSFIKTNIEGTYSILEAGRKNNIKKIIHTSTSEVYGSAQYSPIDEHHPLNPQSPYAATKVAADSLALSYYRSFDLPVTIIRPFNTFGPRQSSRAVISTIISQLLTDNKKLLIGNINTKRDFTFVDDTVDAYIRLLESKKNLGGEVINLGTGSTVSIKKIIETVCDILSINPKLIRDKKRFRPIKSEVKLLISQNKKAKKLLNWKPKYIGQKGLTKSIAMTIDWFKDNSDSISNAKDYKM